MDRHGSEAVVRLEIETWAEEAPACFDEIVPVLRAGRGTEAFAEQTLNSSASVSWSTRCTDSLSISELR